jgi:hypothetical protein
VNLNVNIQNMKKFKLPAVILLALVLGVSGVHAEENTGIKVRIDGPGMESKVRADYELKKLEIRTEMESKRAEVRAEAELKRMNRASSTATSTKMRNASSTEKRIEKQHEIAKRHADKAALRFTAMIERLMTMIERIESRIAKINTEGGVTTEAEASVAAAKGDLVSAQANITILKGITVSGDNFQASFSEVREAAAAVKANLRSAHANMTSAVRALAGFKARANVNATSSATSTATTTSN